MEAEDSAGPGPDTRTGRRQAILAARALHRRRFLQAVGVAGAGMALLHARGEGPLATAQAPGDIDIAELALVLTALETAFWEEGLRRDLLSGRDLEVATVIRDHAVQHRRFIVETLVELGADPAEEPEFVFPEETFTSREALLRTGSRLEELWVEGYHGLLTALQSPELTMAAAALAGNKSRRAAVVARLLDGDALVGPVERAGDPAQLLEEVAEFRGDQTQ